MSVFLYVISTQEFTGKSALCVAFMHRMYQDGYRVGYLKPFSSAARVAPDSGLDEDAQLVKKTFKLTEPIETLSPIVMANAGLDEILTNHPQDFAERVSSAAATVAKNKDIIIVEGGANFREGQIVGLSPEKMVNLLNAEVVAVVGFQNRLQVVDDVLTANMRLNDRLAGVIINFVPPEHQEYTETVIAPYLVRHGVKLLATLPFRRRLRAVDISELHNSLQGELICYDCMDDLVENLVVASAGIDHSLAKFQAVPNKVVIVGGDRPDIQVDALETSTKALIITGELPPPPAIKERAEMQGVAILLSPEDMLTTIGKVESIFGRSRFHQSEKVNAFEELLSRAIDFEKFYRDIGLE